MSVLHNILNKIYNKIPKIPIWINIVAILIGIVLSIITLPSVSNINIQNSIGETKHLSYNQNFEDLGDNYTIDFQINQNWYTQKKFDLFISNCLEKVSIQNEVVLGNKNQTIYSDSDCYGKASFVIENTDPNLINVKVVARNLSTPIVVFRPTIASWQSLVLLLFVVMNLIVMLSNLCKQFEFDSGIYFVFLLSILLHIHYLGYTVASDRSYDIFFGGGHLDYIKHVVNTFRLPDPNSGWETFQPPLYYILAGIIWSIFGNMAAGLFALQLLSLILFSIFSWFGMLIIREFIEPLGQKEQKEQNLERLNDTKNSKAEYNSKHRLSHHLLLASSLFLFIPSGTIHSIRIGNDILQYLTYTIALYYTVLIWKNTDNKNLPKNLIFACISIFASIITKSNGLIIGLILLITLTLKFQKNLKKTILKTYVFVLPILSILVGISINFGRNIIANPTNTSKWIVSSVDTIDPLLAGSNDWFTYLVFDFEGFLTQSFTDTRYDTAREYFWTFLFKTGLFGEFKFYSFIQPELALIISWLAMILVIALILNIIRNLIINLKFHLTKNLVIYLNLIFMLIGLIYYRWKMPFISNNDFRYIYPISISLVILLFSGLSKPQKDLNINTKIITKIFYSTRTSKLLKNIICITTVCFVTCSSVFFINYEYFKLNRQNLPTKDTFYDKFFIYDITQVTIADEENTN